MIQNVGAYLDIPRFLDSDHPIREKADAEACLSRMEAYAGILDGETGRLRDAARKGLIAPAFLIDKAVKQMEASLAGTRDGGSMADSIVRRTAEKGIEGDWGGQAKMIANERIVPALERQLAEMKAQRGKASMEAGMWARPDGDEWYAWALRASTTTSMTPNEVHQMGLDELASYHARMDPILKSLGYTQGPVGERMNALAKDPRYKFSEGDKGRAEIMAFIQDWLGKIRAEMPRAFRTLVRGNLEVKRLPPEEEPGAPGAYGGAGSIDGLIPGKFWINLRTTDLHSKYSLPDLSFHEAIPGHVWQGEYANQMHPIRAMLAFGAYSEGGRSMPSSWPTNLGYMMIIRSVGLAICNRTPFAPVGWWSIPVSMPNAGHENRGSNSLSRKMVQTRKRSRVRSTAIAAGRGKPVATKSAIARLFASADWRKKRWVPPMICAISTTPWSRAAMCRSTYLAKMSWNMCGKDQSGERGGISAQRLPCTNGARRD